MGLLYTPPKCAEYHRLRVKEKEIDEMVKSFGQNYKRSQEGHTPLPEVFRSFLGKHLF